MLITGNSAEIRGFILAGKDTNFKIFKMFPFQNFSIPLFQKLVTVCQ